MTIDSLTATASEAFSPWMAQHSHIVDRLEAMVAKEFRTLQEAKIWPIIAEGCSAEWRRAREMLIVAEKKLAHKMSDDEIPLGGIGFALDAGDMDRVQAEHSLALAAFTGVDEDLREQKEPKALLKMVRERQKTLQKSAQASRLAGRAQKEFDKVMEKMMKTEPKPKAKGRLQREFANSERGGAVFGALNAMLGLVVKNATPEPNAKTGMNAQSRSKRKNMQPV
jgi:hypothetical protein